MLGVILAGAVLGTAALIILKGRRGPEPKPVPIETRDRDRRR